MKVIGQEIVMILCFSLKRTNTLLRMNVYFYLESNFLFTFS